MESTRDYIKKIYEIVGALNKLHPHRNFTPDGIMVGSIGEVLAEYHYALKPLPPGTAAHDCQSGSLMVQVKTTQRKSIQIGEPSEHLLALKLNQDGTVEEFYNGPGEPVWALVKHMMTIVPTEQRIARAKP
jgi:hypothetical protein